jgi:hypothetical protein
VTSIAASAADSFATSTTFAAPASFPVSASVPGLLSSSVAAAALLLVGRRAVEFERSSGGIDGFLIHAFSRS